MRRRGSEEALDHYGGDLLPGLFSPDSEGFQRWLDTERTRVRIAVTGAAIERLKIVEREGKLSEALKSAARIMETSPTTKLWYDA